MDEQFEKKLRDFIAELRRWAKPGIEGQSVTHQERNAGRREALRECADGLEAILNG